MSSSLKVYYWPMLARGAPLVRMLEHTATPYEYISDFAELSKLGSFKTGSGDVFAPPFIVDGDFVISQSTACTLYLGDKLGLTPEGYSAPKAVQYMGDIVDTFEGNLGKNNESGPELKAFLEGDRWAKLAGNIERGIKGPYYFGDSLSCVDFFLAAHLDWRSTQVFNPLKARHGVDALAPFPKMVAIHEAIKATDAHKNFAGIQNDRGISPIKDEILDSYNA